MTANSRLWGKVALITGGGSGVGREAAKCMAKRGARLVLWDISEEGMKITKEQVLEATPGAQVECFVVDITDRQAVYSIAETVQQLQWGTGAACPVWAVVNNAGILASSGTMEETSDTSVLKTIEVNTLAHFWVTKAFLPALKAANDGHIVCVASAAGLTGTASMVAYCTSKFGAVGFAEALRNELRSDRATSNVGVTLLCPAHIKTELFKGYHMGPMALIVRSLEPAEVAEAIALGIENKTPMQILPWIGNAHAAVKGMMPAKFSDFLNGVCGLNKAMHKVDTTHAETLMRSML